jgi:hypothetical protein
VFISFAPIVLSSPSTAAALQTAGQHAMAVVDDALRVYGIDGLRVIDTVKSGWIIGSVGRKSGAHSADLPSGDMGHWYRTITAICLCVEHRSSWRACSISGYGQRGDLSFARLGDTDRQPMV